MTLTLDEYCRREAERTLTKHEREPEVKMQCQTQKRQCESTGSSAPSASIQGGQVLKQKKSNDNEMEKLTPRQLFREEPEVLTDEQH